MEREVIGSRREMLGRLEELISIPEVFLSYEVASEDVDEPGEYLIGYFIDGISEEQKKQDSQITYGGLYEFGTVITFTSRYRDLVEILRSGIESGRITEIRYFPRGE